MEPEIDHNKLLKTIAKERLKPYGIVQKGQSRSFHCDKEWLTFTIEFQPSSWSKGTYLNVGLDFHFYPRAHFAYSYVKRVSDFVAFENEEQFTQVINELCDKTIKRIQKLERKFQDIWTAIETLEKEIDNDPWSRYELAILHALSKDYEKALYELKHLSSKECDYQWQLDRREVMKQLIEWIEQDSTSFLENFKNQINETRILKKLKPVNLDELTERKKSDSSRLKLNKRWLLNFFRFV